MEWLPRLQEHLASLKSEQWVDEVWDDQQIRADDENGWEEQLLPKLKKADVIIVLLSPGFAASKYCQETELPIAIQRKTSGEALVVFVHLKTYRFPESIKRFPMLPSLKQSLETSLDVNGELAKIAGAILDGLKRRDHASSHPEGEQLLALLAKCEILIDEYRPHYIRTIGPLNADKQVLGEASLPAMIQELLNFPPDPYFAGHTEPLVEFLKRVHCEFKARAAPIGTWLEQVPVGAMQTISERLSQESRNLALTIELIESTANGTGFPVSIQAFLTDAHFATTVRTWSIRDLADVPSLEAGARGLLEDAHVAAHDQDVKLSVQVFAKHLLMGVPWHAFRVDLDEVEGDCSEFGEYHPFVLRSRARRLNDKNHAMQEWREKARQLRERGCAEIVFSAAPEWTSGGRDVSDQLSRIDGMLVLGEPLGPFSEATKGLYQVLGMAIRKGLPLLSWPIVHPCESCHTARDIGRGLGVLFGECGSILDTPERLRKARKSEPWARHTALFWDDDDSETIFKKLSESEL